MEFKGVSKILDVLNDNNFMKKIKITYGLPYILLAVLSFLYIRERNDNRHLLNTISISKSINDSTSHKIDELQRKFSQTSQIRTSSIKTFLNIKSEDSSVKKLQRDVKFYNNQLYDGSSVTNFTNNIHIDVRTINGKYSDYWINIDNSKPDNSVVDIRNNYSIALVEDHGEYLAKIRNDNPYSKGIDSIKTFVKIPPPDKKWSISLGVGYTAKGEIIPSIGLYYNIFKIF